MYLSERISQVRRPHTQDGCLAYVSMQDIDNVGFVLQICKIMSAKRTTSTNETLLLVGFKYDLPNFVLSEPTNLVKSGGGKTTTTHHSDLAQEDG